MNSSALQEKFLKDGELEKEIDRLINANGNDEEKLTAGVHRAFRRGARSRRRLPQNVAGRGGSSSEPSWKPKAFATR